MLQLLQRRSLKRLQKQLRWFVA